LWSLVYAVFPKYAILNIVRLDFNQLIYSVVDKVNFNFVFIQQHPFSFIFEGTNAHLWFFMSLIMALSILSAFIYYNKQDYAIYFSALLLCFGLLGGPYMHTILGIRLFYNYHFPVRYGPIFSTFFVVLGWLISYRDKRPSVQLSLLLILAGVILTSLEDLFLLRLFKQAPNYDYVIGTIFYSCGVFFLALSLVRIRKIKFLSSLGVLTLGVYAIHPLVIDNFRFSSSLLGPVLSFILNIAIIFIISCVATLTLYHFKPTRIMVR
jgi:peptidoglycan/LPS O-acetylase OafA/YrhL